MQQKKKYSPLGEKVKRVNYLQRWENRLVQSYQYQHLTKDTQKGDTIMS